jgi:hypothetical protein
MALTALGQAFSGRIVGKPEFGQKRGSRKLVRVESTKTDRLPLPGALLQRIVSS